MNDVVATEIEAAKRKACSIDGYRFIAEQIAALADRPVIRADLDGIIAQALFALKAERELALETLREKADCSHDGRTTDA